MMGELGEILGWATGVCFGAAVLNYFVKRVNKYWILSMPKGSFVRQLYQKLMKFVVKNHRYFGIGAGVAVLLHLLTQLTWQYLSLSGILAAAFLLSTVLIGTVLLYGHRGKLLGLHRMIAAVGVIAFLLHLVIKL